MRWMRLAVIFGVFVVLVASQVAAATAPGPTPSHTESRSAQPIQPAPGGGEMIVVGPDLYYVTQGRVGPDGRLTTQCGRGNPPPAAAQPRR